MYDIMYVTLLLYRISIFQIRPEPVLAEFA